MTLSVQWVPYGRAAADQLRRTIAELKGGEPLTPVTVVVPSNHVGVATRRLLASGVLGPVCERGKGIAAVTFLTPYRLAELLGAARLAGAGRRPVSTPVIAAALRAALVESPGVFGPVAEHPATETALVSTYRELRDCSDAALDAIAGAGPRAADVVALHRAARTQLKALWYDEQDLIAAAVQALGEGGDRLGLGSIVAYLPQRLSPHETALLVAAATALGLTVVAGTTGDQHADLEAQASVDAILARAGPSLGSRTSTNPGRQTDSARHVLVDAARTSIFTASDSDDEVRTALRAVIDAVRAGTPLDRIAILYGKTEPYARLIHEHFAAAGVPTNGAATTPVAARVAGRTLLGVLALPEGGFRRQDVFTWLAGAPILHHGRFAPVTAWERISREAAVVAGSDQWDRLLIRQAEEQELAATDYDADPEIPVWKAEQAREEAARARSLREFVLGLATDMGDAAAKPRRWGEHAAWAAGLLHEFLGGPDRWADWPAAERQGAERVELALARLGALDGVEGPIPLAVFTRTLALELDSDLGRIGRFGEGVLVGSVAMGLGLDLDLVVVLGLAEGSFPARPRDDSLLPDHERQAAGGELPLRRAAVARQHRHLLAALAGAKRHVLGVPRGDLRRSVEWVPSRFLLQLVSGMVGRPVSTEDFLSRDLPSVDHIASFDAGLRRLQFPATEQEHRLQSLLAAGGAPDSVGDAVLTTAADLMAARRSHRFTRFDGNVAGLAVPSPVERITSASRLEKWAGCPLDYFFQHVLGVGPVDNPEEILEITPIDKGNLVHAALETFILEILARPEADRPGPDTRWSAADRARLLEIGEAGWAGYEAAGRTGRRIFWRRDKTALLNDLTRFLSGDDENRALHRTRPLAAELAFGYSDGDLAPVPIALADGRVVRFRGKADRVDVGDDGTLHIVDYKTGSTFGYDTLDEDPVAAGKKLQLPVYGIAARLHRNAPDAPVKAEYWFVSKKGSFKRIGYPVTDEVLGKAATVIDTIVTGIERGVFPAHPMAASTLPSMFACRACDPDRLGVVELRRAWDRKRQDPSLAPYADLAEPLEGVMPEIETLVGDDNA